MWIEHEDTIYNLNRFSQIVRGDDQEILLVAIKNNMDWDHDDEKNICVLRFENREDREVALKLIQVKCSVKVI